jgi:hypothetical protein
VLNTSSSADALSSYKLPLVPNCRLRVIYVSVDLNLHLNGGMISFEERIIFLIKVFIGVCK